MMTTGTAQSPLPAGLSGRPVVYELRGVSKTYKRRNVHALEKIDLRLTQGAFWGIIGSSGCGKSTLLKIMSGLLSPSEGSVVLSGPICAGAVSGASPVWTAWSTSTLMTVPPVAASKRRSKFDEATTSWVWQPASPPVQPAGTCRRARPVG